jgi:hypothetical protein
MAMFSELRLFVAADTGEPAIALVRGEGGAELSSWNRSGRRRSATITVYDIAGQEVARFIMELAWPSKVEISGLKAGASEVLYESVIFQYGSMVTTAQPTGTLTGP